MELVALLHMLVRHRILVGLGAVVAIAAGLMVTRAPSTHYGFANARVVLDTPASQLVDAEPSGADTLSMRAAVLADLMSGGSLKPRIARALGVPEADLAVGAPHRSGPPVALPLPVRALEAAAETTEPYVLAIQAVGPLPIIAIDARGPSRAGAERLAAATTKTLKAEAAAYPPGADVQEFVVEEVGPIRARQIDDGPGKRMAAIVAVLVFGLWSSCVMVASNLRRSRRLARRFDRPATVAG